MSDDRTGQISVRRAACVLLGVLVVTITLAACGADDGGGDGGAALPEAEYIEAGDELCATATEELAAALDDIASDFEDATDIDEDQIGRLVAGAVVRVTQDAVDDFRELEGPEDLTRDVNELLDEIEETIDEIGNDPAILETVEDPFAGLTELGFEECGALE